MENGSETVKTRLSRIALIKEDQTMIFNDRLRIVYKHQKTFRLVWILCWILKNENEYFDLKGVPPEYLVERFKEDGFRITKEDISTLWHDEVMFRRHHENIFNLYKATDIKNNSTIGSGKLLSDVFQAIFGKIKPPENSSYHRNTRLYTVLGDIEQISLFDTIEDAKACGYDEAGTSYITRHRTVRGAIGFLDSQHSLEIDKKGNADSLIYLKIVNLSSLPISRYMLPLWSEEPLKKLKAWLKTGEEIPIEITMNTNGKKKNMEFILSFPKPILPGEVVEFNYSVFVSNCYKVGHEYFEWYFDHPQSEYSVDIHVPSELVINRPVVYEGQEKEFIPVQIVSKKHIKWHKYFPKVGSTYRIDFILEKRKK